jgi:hypothetical protein
MPGSKRVGHRTSDTVYECSEIAGLPRGSPQQPTMLVVKPEGGSAGNVKPGKEELCEIKCDYNIVGVMA